MYQCPNCSGNMKFYIPSQMLRCDYCTTEMDPYAFHQQSDVEESNDFNVTIFTCPQCAGELMSTEYEATAFCSFCGASNILTSRISSEKRPSYIIPFQKTKEDCKASFHKMMKKSLYTPKQLRKVDNINGFRGIYMPYWFYNVSQKGPGRVKGTDCYRSGDYVITDHYNLDFYVDSEYDHISFDSSASFADNLSTAIAPFDVRKAKEFTPAFLSGFYADTADVIPEVYTEDATAIANKATYKQLTQTPAFRKYDIQDSGNNSQKTLLFNTQCSSVERAMLPVWFLSYRQGDRIAYAAVNGQTGKIAADLPVDPKRYLFGSLLTAIPLYILLNMFFTPTPTATLLWSIFFAIFTLILYTVEIFQIKRKDNDEDDKGMMSKKAFYNPNKTNRVKIPTTFLIIILVTLVCFCVFTLPSFISISMIDITSLGFIPIVASVVFSFIIGHNIKQLKVTKKHYGFIGASLSLIISTFVIILNPVWDYIYYIGAIASIVAIFFSIYDLIYYFNILATRKLPQFNRTGGDDCA